MRAQRRDQARRLEAAHERREIPLLVVETVGDEQQVEFACSAIRAISWITARSLLLTAAPSQRQPAEWLPAPSTKTPRCIWRVAADKGILLPILDGAYPDKDERAVSKSKRRNSTEGGGRGRSSLRGLLCDAAPAGAAKRGLRGSAASGASVKSTPPGARVSGARVRSQPAPENRCGRTEKWLRLGRSQRSLFGAKGFCQTKWIASAILVKTLRSQRDQNGGW